MDRHVEGRLEWQRSTYCDSGACFEVSGNGNLTLLRNSTQPDALIAVTREAWSDFVAGIKEDAGGVAL